MRDSETAHPNVRLSPWALGLAFLRSHWALLLRFVLTSLGRTATAITVILLIREFLSGVLGEHRGMATWMAQTLGTQASLGIVATVLLLTFLVGSVLNYDNQVVMQRVVRLVELELMERLIRHLLALPVAFFDRQHHGDILESVRQDVSKVRLAMMALIEITVEGMQAAAYLGSVLLLSPRLAFTSLPVLLLAVGPVWWMRGQIRTRSLRARRLGYGLSDLLLQILRGIRIVKIYAGENLEASNSIEKARRYFDELLATVRARALGQVAVEALGGLSLVVVILLGGFHVMDGTLSVPALVAFLVAARALHGPLNNMNTQYLEIQRQWASVHRLRELLETQPDLSEHPDAVPLTEPPRNIRFEEVSFGYDPRSAVLTNLSFEAHAGEQIGIVGPSGTGKTTLVSLVARFYDPTSGRVLLNGRDLREYSLSSIHRQIAIVTQDPFLFGTTVRENIRYGRPGASNDEVETAARAAEIHDELLALPEGYETVVGVGGRVLSAGQVQRVNVARALLKDAPLLILDEATSSLDSIAESKVQSAINRLMQGCTTFIVAHRLSTLRHADRVIVLDDGRAVGIGSHESLLRQCPLYRKLWKTQEMSERSGRGVGAQRAEKARHDLVLGPRGR